MRLSPLKEYFYYTRNERNGALALILLLIFLFTIPSFYPLIFPRKVDVDYSAFENMLPVAKPVTEYSDNSSEHKTMPVAVEVSYFDFDPNTATKEELLQLGLSSHVAQTILNYRGKGGRFRNKEELKKIYGLQEEDYAQLEEWIEIAPQPQRVPSKSTPISELQDTQKAIVFEKTARKVYPTWSPEPSPDIDINQTTPEEDRKSVV